MLTFAECEEGGNGRRFSPGKARFQCGLGSSLTRPWCVTWACSSATRLSKTANSRSGPILEKKKGHLMFWGRQRQSRRTISTSLEKKVTHLTFVLVGWYVLIQAFEVFLLSRIELYLFFAPSVISTSFSLGTAWNKNHINNVSRIFFT